MRAILAAVSVMLCSFAAVAAESRVALVIGNSNYQYAGALPNPRNDATDIAATLRDLGFKVIEGTDLTRAGMEKTLRQFGDAVFQADVALLFYAGHGIEINGSNYLLPVDAKLSTENDAAFEAIPMDLALRMTEPAKRLRVVILDACRNNPLAAQMKRLDNKRALGGGGFAPIEPVADTLVAYATKAGRTASDGEGRNSPFSQALLKLMREPGLEISLMFRKVRDQVLQTTERRQEPFVYGSLGGDLFFFKPGASIAVAADPASEEIALWKKIKDSVDNAPFADYLQRYPQGLFFDLAHQRMVKPAVTATGPARSEGPIVIALKDRKPGEVFRDCEDCPQMVALPVDGGLAAGRFEVTRAEFARFVKDSGHTPTAGCYVYSNGRFEGKAENGWRNPGFNQIDLDPAVCLSFEDASRYTAWLAQKTGQAYRLLSDTEWDFAARAGGADPPWPADDPRTCQYENGADRVAQGQYSRWKVANCEDGFVYTAPVGRFAPNAFGLYDMLGNAAEWVEGCYSETPGASCEFRIMRGGSWYAPPALLRPSYRDRNFASNRGSITGFRVARGS